MGTPWIIRLHGIQIHTDSGNPLLWPHPITTIRSMRTTVKDLPMHAKRVGIYVDTRRYRCHACRKTFYEVLPDVNAK